MKNFMFKSERGYFLSVEKAAANCFTHSLFSYGDYHGSSVQRTNVKALLEMESLVERLGIEECHEGYNSTSLIFPIASLQDAELQEIFSDLENYPVIDDQLLSDTEMEMERSDWNDFGRSDFKRYLESNGLLENENGDEIIEIELTDEQLDSIYFEVASNSNYNIWECENGNSGHFNFKSFGGLYAKALELIKTEINKLGLNENEK